MLKIIYGEKGTGKTKRLITMANDAIESTNGSVVFLDDDKNYMYDLKNTIRFIDVKDYPKMSPEMFAGFIYGMAAQDFDLEHIFIDGIWKILDCPVEALDGMFKGIHAFSEKRGIIVTVSMSGASDDVPAFIKPYII